MISTDALFQLGDSAEEAGDNALARQCFERGAALGDATCLSRLARMFDLGLGMSADKTEAMRLYYRAWCLGDLTVAGSNIAILWREKGNHRAAFRWWQRVAAEDDGSAQLEMAKCYLEGAGISQDLQAGIRCLAAAVSSIYITEYEREEAQTLLEGLRPRSV